MIDETTYLDRAVELAYQCDLLESRGAARAVLQSAEPPIAEHWKAVGRAEAEEDTEDEEVRWREERNACREALKVIAHKATDPKAWPPMTAWTRVQWAAEIAQETLDAQPFVDPVIADSEYNRDATTEDTTNKEQP